MRVGLLPALGGGIRELATTGQQSRLVDGYLRPYARAFDGLYYFSYLPESLAEFTDDPELLARVTVLASPRPLWRGRRALAMTRAHATEFRQCDVLRVFQITGVIPALAARRRFGIPYVTTYGFSYGRLSRPGPKRWVKAVVERRGLRRAAAVIATTEALRARALSLGARRVELIPNGVDTGLFAFRGDRAGRPPGAPRRILYVGRLSEEKNLETLVWATPSAGAAIQAQHGAGVQLVTVGAGPQKDELEALARELRADVQFLGVMDQRTLPEIYASADAFVLASFTEGHPKVLLEAMACGLPCVASDCEGNRSIVTHEKTGLLFDPRSPEALSSCLVRVLTEPGLAASLASAARALIEERYGLPALVAREIALLEDVGRGRR
ncbi:MAG: glycosyltransferase family 4 protein [Candidatus Rokubacteria bacterium]|nr:glycosyltransferase family 4 protein [Candidatus Rokubacteria bacterium]